MIKGLVNVNGRRILLLGIEEENVRRLKEGKPIHVRGAEMGVDTDVVILYGETPAAIMTTLRDEMGLRLPDDPEVGAIYDRAVDAADGYKKRKA